MMQMPDSTDIAFAFAQRKFWHNHRHIKVTIDGQVHHYGKNIADWIPTRAFGRQVYVPVVGFDGSPTNARMLLLREIVRVLGVPHMEFGLISNDGTSTPTLNGAVIDAYARIPLCEAMGAISLAQIFNHPPQARSFDELQDGDHV